MAHIYISWEDIGLLIDKLADKIKIGRPIFDGIYGIPRGGLPLAVALSHRLNLPLLMHPTKDSLVVDDISDTGKTLASHRNKFIATLHTTDWTITKPTCSVAVKEREEDWIVYPWEKWPIKSEGEEDTEKESVLDLSKGKTSIQTRLEDWIDEEIYDN